MRNKWFTVLVYVSLVFLMLVLARKGYLYIPTILDLPALLLSISLMFSGFLTSAITWHRSIRERHPEIHLRDSIISIGLSIFMKYLPGKIWSILGPPGYIATTYDLSTRQLSAISLDNQLLLLWSGLLIGIIGLLLNESSSLALIGMSASLTLLLGAAIFSQTFHGPIENLASLILKKSIQIPRIPPSSAARILPYHFLTWAFWCSGFYFLSTAVTNDHVAPTAGAGFALGATLGIMAIIAPGGIGVREGIISGYLAATGIGLAPAATIAVTSRLWFLVGEFFMFLVALTLKNSGRPRKGGQSARIC